MHPVIEKNPDLKIPVGLARILKDYGFTRTSVEDGNFLVYFEAIINKVQFTIKFYDGMVQSIEADAGNRRFLIVDAPTLRRTINQLAGLSKSSNS